MKWLGAVFGIATIILGTLGFIQEGFTTYEAFVKALPYLVLSGSDEPGNYLIEAARISGVIFGGNIIIAIIESAWSRTKQYWEKLRNLHRINTGKITTAVHGDGSFAEGLITEMDGEAISASAPGAERAPNQVLLFSSDDKAIQCFNDNTQLFSSDDKKVYVGLDQINTDAATKDHVYGFSMAQIGVELYWRMYPVTSAETIAIIGSGAWAEEIILHGLLTNIYDVKGGVTYHAYGDFERFKNLHPKFDKAVTSNGDTFTFPTKDWSDDIDWLKSCTRIVLCESGEENLKIASQMRAVGIDCAIHMRSDSEENLALLGSDDSEETAQSYEPKPNYVPQQNEIRAFGTAKALCTKAIVIQEKHHEDGKICDISYRLGNKGARKEMHEWADEHNKDKKNLEIYLDCPTFLEDYTDPNPDKDIKGWDNYDEFTRASNYAVAAHDRQKIRLLLSLNIDAQKFAETLHKDKDEYTVKEFEDNRDYLQEIEHIRWNRFHFLKGWEYGDPKGFPRKNNGKPNNKWPAKRLHSLLVPYTDLSDEDKRKDEYNYQTLWQRRETLIKEMSNERNEA